MAIYRSPEQYRLSIRKRVRGMLKTARDNAAKASFSLTADLKSTGPIKTGKLVQSVRRRKTKHGFSVLAGYNRMGFNVGKYINMEFNKVLTPTRKYPTRNATSKVNPWFTKNVEKTIKKYRAGYRKVRAAIRSR